MSARLIAELHALADRTASDGDAALRDGLYTRSNAAYVHAARIRRAATAMRDGRPVRTDDAKLVAQLRQLAAAEAIAEKNGAAA